MTADHTTLPVLGVIFLATVIRSAFGFGEALVAVPLLALIIPVEVAAPVTQPALASVIAATMPRSLASSSPKPSMSPCRNLVEAIGGDVVPFLFSAALVSVLVS